MRFNGKNLAEVLDAHQRWISGVAGFTADDRADLRWANLQNADLRGADLRWADLHEADLHGACLQGASLRGAYLCWAVLSWANLVDVDLSEADLRGADLSEADLRGAILDGTLLNDSNLRGANLAEAKNVPFIPMCCPDTGAFVGWKICRDDLVVKLLIPEDAKRSSAMGRMCRCDKAVVLDIQDIRGNSVSDVKAISRYDNGFTYQIGQTIVPQNGFDENRFIECASGIHFFISRDEAVNYGC